MNVLEQVCQIPATHQVHRILILCDRDGFANMKRFLCENMSDCVYYIDEWAVSINELFIMTDDEDYLISCDDYTFHNLVNVVLCSQTSNPMKNVPSLFYDLFTNEENKDIIDIFTEETEVPESNLPIYDEIYSEETTTNARIRNSSGVPIKNTKTINVIANNIFVLGSSL